jgi:uncharacterized protein (DUF1697 family)
MAGSAHLALLRGIDVGGKNKLLMNVLVAMFIEAGCKDVRTYILSGNVIFNASKFDSKLATIGTSRNWRTVTKLLELMEGGRQVSFECSGRLDLSRIP